jgi:hypothetical protein
MLTEPRPALTNRGMNAGTNGPILGAQRHRPVLELFRSRGLAGTRVAHAFSSIAAANKNNTAVSVTTLAHCSYLLPADARIGCVS